MSDDASRKPMNPEDAKRVVDAFRGLIQTPSARCPICRGSGKVYDTTRGPHGDEEICPACFGEGDGPELHRGRDGQ